MPDPLSILRQALAAGYRVERELGQGGMATVFLARDLKHDRPVAIKVLRPELASSIGPERFLREIEIAARLQHPNVLPVYDSGQADGILYYIMPFVEGESLRDRLVREGPLAPADAVRVAGEVADALDYAHRMGIVHRDIKPANILLSQGHAVVADFGVARAVSTSAEGGLTQAGMAVGSPHYMSPEQALGGAEIDGRTDTYALGIVLHEMLEGKPPFEGTTPQSIIAKALSGRPARLVKDPLGVQPVIDRALAREPQDRFATAGDMKAALVGLTTGTGFRLASPRSRRSVILAAVALLALVAAVVFLRPGGGGIGDPRKSLIVFPFENRTGDPGQDYLEEAAMNLLGLAASHWADLRVYDDERTASLLRRRGFEGGDLDFEAAREIAREAQVGTLVVGDLRREGDSLAIEAKVHDVRSGERLATHIVRVSRQADPRPLFDQLAARILGTSGAPPGERPSVLAQTTSSLDAYRAYLAGTAALQRFQIDSAKTLLDRAIALDSTFALAYLRRSDAEGWGIGTAGGDPRFKRDLALAAERHSATLPQRLRTLVEFHRAYNDNNFPRARAAAGEMIARDSTDVEAWYQLGEAHYHDRANSFPHPADAGNLGLALNAFQRALALDSTYILAYQHIIDALGNCAGSNTRVCTADSAVYGMPDTLAARFGEPRLAERRQQANDEQIATARGWVAAAPATQRARQALVLVLFNQERYADALREVDALARTGNPAGAEVWRALTQFMLGDYGASAASLDSALALPSDTISIVAGMQNGNIPIAMLAGAGRLEGASAVSRTIYRSFPLDSVPGPAGIRYSKEEIERLIHGYRLSEAGSPELASVADEAWRMIDQRTTGDTAARRRYYTTLGTSALATYLVIRDTARLAAWLSMTDTTGSATWRVADGLLSLARGDTARARARVDLDYRRPGEGEFSGEQGVLRSFAWGRLLSHLGEPRLALEAYARMDSAEARIQHPGWLLRSLLERAALLGELGDRGRAIELYQRWLAAWEDADAALQPEVDRVRRRMAALRGDPG